MSPSDHLKALIKDIQYNCDVSDARDHGIYSMCTLILRLRNLYKWENHIEPWDEPAPAILLDWVEAKEKYWSSIAERPFVPVTVDATRQHQLEPYQIEQINLALGGTPVYGAGFGRSLKAVFFLAQKKQQIQINGCPVLILGPEYAREMASPFAMVQDGNIIIRTEPLRFFIWDQLQELGNSCRKPMRFVLQTYQLLDGDALNRKRCGKMLDRIVEDQMPLFIYHEIGEILQLKPSSASMQSLVSRFPGTVVEFACRAVKDVLADTHPKGPLAFIIDQQNPLSLGFYISLFDGLREKLFPELLRVWPDFESTGDWRIIERGRKNCRNRLLRLAGRIDKLASMPTSVSDEEILQQFTRQVLKPLGLVSPTPEKTGQPTPTGDTQASNT